MYLRTITIKLLIFLFAIPLAQAQLKKTDKILLNTYTYKNAGGKFEVSLADVSTPIKMLDLSGEDASYFKISGKGSMKIKPAADKKVYHLTVNVKTDVAQFSQDFTILKDEFISNKVIAHRGAWKNTPTTENSIASLKAAIALGCEGSEFDVHLSADTVPFIHHDGDYKGITLEKSKAETLHQLLLENREKLPSLAAYLEAGKGQNKTKLILEIKPTKGNTARKELVIQTILATVAQTQTQALVDYISFDEEMCLLLLKANPFAKVAYLNGDKSPSELYKAHISGFDYHVAVVKKHPEWIKEAHKLGLTVNVWTVNTKEDLQWMLDHEVDFITTNEPEMLLQMVK